MDRHKALRIIRKKIRETEKELGVWMEENEISLPDERVVVSVRVSFIKGKAAIRVTEEVTSVWKGRRVTPTNKALTKKDWKLLSEVFESSSYRSLVIYYREHNNEPANPGWIARENEFWSCTVVQGVNQKLTALNLPYRLRVAQRQYKTNPERRNTYKFFIVE